MPVYIFLPCQKRELYALQADIFPKIFPFQKKFYLGKNFLKFPTQDVKGKYASVWTLSNNVNPSTYTNTVITTLNCQRKIY